MKKNPPRIDPYSLSPVSGDRLIGRDELRARLKLYLTEQPAVILITGERGIGKTSLLNDIEQQIPEMKFLPIHRASQGQRFWDTIGLELERLAGTARKPKTSRISKVEAGVRVEPGSYIPLVALSSQPVTPAQEAEMLRFNRLCQALRERGKSLCIRVEDAFNLGPDDQRLLQQLTAGSDCVHVILEVPDNMKGSIVPEIMRLHKPLGVGRLKLDAAKEIAEQGDFLSPEQVAQLVAFADGNPYYLQTACYVLWHKHQAGDDATIPEILTRIAESEVQKQIDVVHDEIVKTIPERFRPFIEDVAIAPFWFTDEMAALFSVGQASRLSDRKTCTDAVNALKAQGLLIEENPFLRLYHSRFRDYLKKAQRLPDAEIAARYVKAAQALAANDTVSLLLWEQYDKGDLLARLCAIVTSPCPLHSVAERLHLNGRPKEALGVWQRLADVSETDPGWRTAAYGNMALVYQTWGQLDKALVAQEQTLKVYRELKDRRNEAAALGNIGLIYQTKGDLDMAIRYHEDALKIDQEIGYQQGAANQFGNAGNVYQLKGEGDKALKYYEDALKIQQEIGDQPGAAAALGNIGLIYRDKGDLDTALKRHEEALKIAKTIGYQQGAAQQLIAIGLVQAERGKSDEALESYGQALEIHRAIGFRQGEATALGNIGNVYELKDELDKALKCFEDALKIHQEVGDKQGAATDFGNIGIIYKTKGDLDTALKYYEDALKIDQEIGYQQGAANQLANTGLIHQDKGEGDKALTCYLSALATYIGIGVSFGPGIVLGNLRKLYGQIGRVRFLAGCKQNGLNDEAAQALVKMFETANQFAPK